MASSCVLNRLSKPKTTTRYEKTSNSFILSTNSGNNCVDFESGSFKSHKNVDLSWLPNYDDEKSTSESQFHDCEIDFDYSWLPDHVDAKRNGSTAASKSSNCNRSTESENDSWLPSTPIVNGGTNDSWLPNCNDVKRNTSTIPSNPNIFIRPRKTENDSNYSSFCSTHITTNGDQSKETIINNNKHKKSKNQDQWKRAHEFAFSDDQQIQHAKPFNKKPESSKSLSPKESDRCSVETDSLGGVSTLRRRFQDLVETKNTHRKAKSSSGSNDSKSPLELTEDDINSPQRSPLKFFDASDGAPSPSTPADSFVDAEKDKIQAAGNTNESFARICKTWNHKQVAGGKPRLLRGWQVFKDFLKLMEQDKQRELKILSQRKPVSQFSHRARIRAVLRLRFIEDGPTNNQDDDIQLDNFHDCISEYSESESDWEEEQQQEEKEEEEDWDMQPFQDWMSDIARPRSHWECLRLARYKEMLHLYAYKQEIRELLERRSVTGFLSSDLRGKIDELLVSRTEGIELRKEGIEGDEDGNGGSRVEREYRKYNEFIHQRSSSIVSCC